MDASENLSWWADDSTGARTNSILLGRLGDALEGLYHSTLSAPLPASLQQLTARLDSATNPPAGSFDDNVT